VDQPKEAERLRALESYGVLDTAPEEAFDRLTQLAADLFDAPVALVSLIDAERQWFKSRHGVEADSTPRSLAFCAHAIELDAGETLVVPDATTDPRFRDNPLVTGDPNIRFYAGAVLTGSGGFNLGTLCVIDNKARAAPSPSDLRRLKTLASMVVDELELRRALRVAAEKSRILDMAERLSGLGHWSYRPGADRVEWSDETYHIYGLSKDSFDPTVPAALARCWPEDVERLTQVFQTAIETGEGYEGDLRIVRDGGEIRNVIVKAECLLGEDDKVHTLCGVIHDVTEQRRAVRRLERGQARFKLLADNVADVIARIRLNGECTYITPSVTAMLGYSPADLAGRRTASFVHGPDRPALFAVLDRMSKGLDTDTIQPRAVHKDGHLVWVEARCRLVRDASGAPFEVVAVISDISEHKAFETAMAKARDEAEVHARRAELAESIAGLGHWRLDVATQAVTWSAQMYRIYGVDPNAPLDLPALMDMNHPDERAESQERVRRQIETGEAQHDTTTRIVRPNGELRYLAGNSEVERDENGVIVAVVGTVVDVTAQKTAELALVQSEHRFRGIANTASDMIIESGLDSLITYVSPASFGLIGFTPDELIGVDTRTLMQPLAAAKVHRMCQAMIASKGAIASWPIEFRTRHKEGHEIWLECKPALTVDPVTGQFTGITDIIRDVTPRKALEGQLRRAQAEAEAAAHVKGEFLANMSHELRTPLTSVVGFTQLAAEQPELSALTRGYIERVGDASRALLCTVNDILDFSKLEAGQVSFQPQPIVLAKLGRATLDLFTPQAAAKDLTLTLEDAGGVAGLVVSLDPDRIRQILLNLVGNAVKFTDAGGVTLRGGYDQQAGVLKVEVIDTGPGIPAERRAVLFQRFSQVDGSLTRSHGGTGLGLAICKGLVEAMGGKIGVDSREGEGSRFWFEIPAPLAVLPGAQDEGPVAEQPTFAGLRVLVVDDHPANRELARLFLAGVGAEVSEAVDGEEAVELAAIWPYDAILMDLRMPRLDGPGAMRRIREEAGPNDATPILAFSADIDGPLTEKLLASGFQGVVAKPLEPGALFAAIAAATAFTVDLTGDEVVDVA
jgi:PAS domain S-box-containing protein